MPEKPFTKYLVKLATDAAEVRRLRTGGDVARASMAAAGLTDPDLQNVLLSGNAAAIDAAVSAELEATETIPGTTAIPVRIVSLVQVHTKPPPAQ